MTATITPITEARQRREYMAKARRKRVRQVANELVKESDWRGRLARSVLDVIDIDDCTEVYGDRQ